VILVPPELDGLKRAWDLPLSRRLTACAAHSVTNL
jgi:hypothetical protein